MTPAEEIESAIRADSLQPGWTRTPDHFVHTESKNLWTRLRDDYNLHGFIQFGIGTDEFWETRTGMEVDLVPDGRIRLGLEAGVGHWHGCNSWCDDWD